MGDAVAGKEPAVGVALALLLANAIAGAVKQVAAVAEQVALTDVPGVCGRRPGAGRGDLTRTSRSRRSRSRCGGRDEIGADGRRSTR